MKLNQIIRDKKEITLSYSHLNSKCTVHIFKEFIGISNLYTNPNYRNKGNAQLLIKEVKKRFPNATIKGYPENNTSKHIANKLNLISLKL